jgi:hypothetical protein
MTIIIKFSNEQHVVILSYSVIFSTFCTPSQFILQSNYHGENPSKFMSAKSIDFLFQLMILRYHNNVTNLIHFHFHNHFIVS